MDTSSSKKVLWVLEDSLSIQFILRKALEGFYEMRFFRTLAEFGEAVRRCPAPSGLIADLRLEDGTFLNVMAEQEPFIRTVPTIVVSGVDDIEVLRQCFARGAKDYIHKPFGRNELFIKVENLVHSSVTADDEPLIDSASRVVSFGAKATPSLTPKEYRILGLLPYKKYVSRENLVSCALKDAQVKETSLDVHLVALRRKLRTVGLSIQHDSDRGYFLTALP